MESLEKRFNKDMNQIYQLAKKKLNYNATRFMQLVSERGGVQAAKQLISKDLVYTDLKSYGKIIG